MSRRQAVQGDDGAGTVLLLCVVMTLLCAGFLVLAGAQLVLDRARVHAAADLGAIGGAEFVLQGTSCEKANEVVRANGARLESCQIVGTDVVIESSVAAGPLIQRLTDMARTETPRIYGIARAGPKE